MTTLFESLSLMLIHDVFSRLIPTYLLFSWIRKPILDRDPEQCTVLFFAHTPWSPIGFNLRLHSPPTLPSTLHCKSWWHFSITPCNSFITIWTSCHDPFPELILSQLPASCPTGTWGFQPSFSFYLCPYCMLMPLWLLHSCCMHTCYRSQCRDQLYVPLCPVHIPISSTPMQTATLVTDTLQPLSW